MEDVPDAPEIKIVENLTNRLLEKAFDKGDVSIHCKNGEIVRADRIFLETDPYFQALFNFKTTQGSANEGMTVKLNEGMTVDLSDYEVSTVKALIECIYTGAFVTPETLQTQLELYNLAQFVANTTFSSSVLKVIEKEGYDLSDIMQLAARTGWGKH